MREELLLTNNKWSRPGTKILEHRGIILHWTGVPGQSAKIARDFFESLKHGKNDYYASAHYVVDEEGPILCVPEDEIAYHSGAPSYREDAEIVGIPPWKYAIGVEMCFRRKDGKPEDATIGHTVQLVKDICQRHDMMPFEHVYRHYDMTGKICPKYYVRNEIEWIGFKQRIYELLVAQPEFERRRKRGCRSIINCVRGLFGLR